MEEIKRDKRFSHIVKDVRFRKIPKAERKVKIDKRFQSMFTDERFQLNTFVDKRGRPQISKGTEHLQRFYDLSDDSGKEDEEENEKPSDDIIQSTKQSRKDLDKGIKAKLRDLTVDYARGEGRILSDSSSDEDSSSEEEEEEELEHDWAEFDREAPPMENATNRLALCNMDWDRITAPDIMVLIHSFLPGGGALESVTVYPSEFGLKRLKEEEEQGPPELTTTPVTDDCEEEDMNDAQREKLREYQLKRLKYYYAVLVFDSAKTAEHVYKECDGLEYESSMNRLDLRFIPDDTTFDQTPREDCKTLPDMSTYRPRHYRTTALTQVKVDLTWDETDPTRREVIQAAHSGKLNENQLENFLASSSEDEDVENEQENLGSEEKDDEPYSEKKAIEKYKMLLADLAEEKKDTNDVAMEVTWDLKLEQKAAEKVKKAAEANEKKTPFEQYLEKRKEKRKSKKKQRDVGKDEEGSNPEEPFSDDELPSDVDLNDPYFKEEHESIKSKNKKKLKARLEEESEEKQQEKAELELLMLDEVNEGPKQHFNLKDIEDSEKRSKKRKFRKKKATATAPLEDNFKMDVKDERFSAIFTSHVYNVDPAEPHFKPTPGMKAIIEEKIKRKCAEDVESSETTPTPVKMKKDTEINLLVKSVQRKTQALKKKQS